MVLKAFVDRHSSHNFIVFSHTDHQYLATVHLYIVPVDVVQLYGY
jgi:hypothetical protein